MPQNQNDLLLQEAAKQVLRNDALNTILTELQKQYILQLTSSQPSDVQEREALYHKITAVNELQQWVENYGR